MEHHLDHGPQTISISNPSINEDLPTHALAPFVLITFAITWGIAGSYIFFSETTIALFGKMEGVHPLYFVMAWGPGIAGLLLVVLHGGRQGLRRFLSRLFLWRCSPIWWLFILIGLPLIFMSGSLFKEGGLLVSMEDGVGRIFLVALVMLFLGPMEEFGWHGVAKPLLQRILAPFWASALIGAIWGIWHLPAFYLSGTVYADWDFPLFLIGTITLMVLVTPIFNATRGGLLLPMLFHWQLINPFWPDAQPWDTWMLVALTALVVWWKRKTMFSSAEAATTVISH